MGTGTAAEVVQLLYPILASEDRAYLIMSLIDVVVDQGMSVMPYWQEPEEGDLIMTLKDWHAACDADALTDVDGFGHPMKDGLIDNRRYARPSKQFDLPKDCTHIVWYGR